MVYLHHPQAIMSTMQLSYPSTIDASWGEVLLEEFQKPYMDQLAKFLKEQRAGSKPVYPPKDLVFNALNHTPFGKVKVIIVGQDPYHGKGQAHGLSFSVPRGVKVPPSLRNIYLEIQKDLGLQPPDHGNLVKWADQGVLLLNATLTVRESEPKSHYGQGWERFTDAVIEKLHQEKDHCIFVLWGRSAKEKLENVLKTPDNQRHLFLTAAHPSPFSAYNGFFGCGHFSKINKALKKWNKEPIDWSL